MIDLEKKKFDKFWAKASQTLDTDSYDAFEIWLESTKQAQAEITDLKQQLSEAHKSRASWVEYSQKIESGEFVLVPRNANDDMWKSGWREFEISESMHKAYKAMIEASQQPTNLIDSFIADGGFDRVMGCKNGE